MLYGGASAGVRAMTASSGPGISLMQEGFSYLAGAELPCVIADIMRGGPGLGNIAPEQGDYYQIVKGGGHGNYRTLVLAPASVQEMADLTTLAFDLADRYRNPVVVLADGYIGQMMEPVAFADAAAGPGRRRRGRSPGPPHTRPQPDHFHLPGARRAWSGTCASWRPSTARPSDAKPRGEAWRDRRRGDRPGGLRHRGARAARPWWSRPARAASARDCCGPSRCIPSRPRRSAQLAAQAKALRGGRDEHRADGRRRAPGAGGPAPGGVLQPRGRQRSRRPKRCWQFVEQKFAAGARVPAEVSWSMASDIQAMR